MPRVRIEFTDDNPAFEADHDGEVRHVLVQAAALINEKGLLDDGDDHWLQDTNGYRVGSVRVL